MHLPAGMITDRLGIGRTLLMCLACMFLGNIVPAMFSDFKLAVLGRVVTGIGTGTCFVVTLIPVMIIHAKIALFAVALYFLIQAHPQVLAIVKDILMRRKAY